MMAWVDSAIIHARTLLSKRAAWGAGMLTQLQLKTLFVREQGQQVDDQEG